MMQPRSQLERASWRVHRADEAHALVYLLNLDLMYCFVVVGLQLIISRQIGQIPDRSIANI